MGVCTCAQCINHLYKDIEGKWQAGRVLDALTITSHLAAERMKRKAARRERSKTVPGGDTTNAVEAGEGDVANAVFLATVQEESSNGGGLPVRSRDCQTRSSGASSFAQTPESQGLPDPQAVDAERPQSSGNATLSAEPGQEAVSSQAGSLSESMPDGLQPNLSPEDLQDALVRERKLMLSSLESLITLRSRRVSSHAKLRFYSPPTSISDPPAELDRADPCSADFLVHYAWVSSQLRLLRDMAPVDNKQEDRHLESLIRKFIEEISRLQTLERNAWTKEMVVEGLLRADGSAAPEPVVVYPPEPYNPRTIPHFILAALCMVTILHSVASLARPYTQFILHTLRLVLFGALTYTTNPTAQSVVSSIQETLLGHVPFDIRTVMLSLHVEPTGIIEYAMCPTCCYTYAPDPSNPDNPYPHTCVHSETDKPVCGTSLVISTTLAPLQKGDPPRVVYKAIKVLPFRTLKSYVAGLFTRFGVEDIVEGSWTRTARRDGFYDDIMQSPAIQNFIGPDGRSRFSAQTHGSIHLVFSLFVDWFNPHGNKKAGKCHSIGAVYMVCDNLPPHLRFRPEYMFLATLIPGPKEPSLHELNHILRPLVDELLEFWHQGVYLKRTATRLSGRLVRAALIPLVCDLPAVRKMAGFTHYAHRHFCSFCPLLKSDISNPDRTTWPPCRTWEEHALVARACRDAPTEARRQQIFDDHGLRWSELLRLEYWDPTKYALVDTMHNLFLGEIRHHCMDVWGVGNISEKAPKSLSPHTPREQQQHLDQLFASLCKKASSSVKRTRKDYLLAVARFNKIEISVADPTKQDITDALFQRIETMSEDQITRELRMPPPLPETTDYYRLPEDDAATSSTSVHHVFTREVRNQLRLDISNMVVPSWIEKPPRNFGSASHGKLKADQWRTVGTIFMAVTLVRLWCCPTASQSERAALTNFVHLVVAVDSATRRSMSASRAALFDKHMEQYIKGLRTLYKHPLVPNHHMSLHLKPCLELFGPVYGWWSYPFERYNGILQRLNSNYKPAEMPLTFMRYFYIGANLRWLISTINWPDADIYREWFTSFQVTFREATRGTRFTDLTCFFSAPIEQFKYEGSKESILPRTVYDRLCDLICSGAAGKKAPFRSAYDSKRSSVPHLPHNGQLVSSIDWKGVKYSTSTSAARNSYVIFRDPLNGFHRTAGQIDSIFYHRRVRRGMVTIEPFIVIRMFSPLSTDDKRHDPFRSFPGLEAKLFYDKMEDDLRVVPPDNMVCHFAMLKWTPEGIATDCIVVKSLDRN